jgi:hypothetical protein
LHFQPSLTIPSKAGAYSNGSLLMIKLPNIRIALKFIAMTKTLAYNTTISNYRAKSFIVQANGHNASYEPLMAETKEY